MHLPITIAGMGHYLPSQVVGNAELESRLELPPGWIERVSGVRERRYADGESSVSMAAEAARRALAAARLSLDAVDAIIGASAAPHQAIPCTAALVQRELGAPEGRSFCYDINATCTSFLVALHNASALIATGAASTVLIFSSELSHYSLNWREPTSAVLFGDAAAAAVVTRATAGASGALWQARFATHSSGADHTRVLGGGTGHHPNAPRTTPEMNTFHMDGRAVFKQAARLLPPFVDNFFASLGWDRREVLVIPHQASRHGLELLTERLGFRAEQLVINLPTRGNCIAASIPLALSEAVESGLVRRGQRLLLIGTGAGLTIGAIALTW
ncbi:MAG: ketoacyl-ACP synthase III [Chloroflexaceae bacterium]|jgi:3-oxoacyl-[acyl-carrier-protein] synthase-3|nr:ketoacyl-ACP synthase III [Chloroflexaceae bacterium]